MGGTASYSSTVSPLPVGWGEWEQCAELCVGREDSLLGYSKTAQNISQQYTNSDNTPASANKHIRKMALSVEA